MDITQTFYDGLAAEYDKLFMDWNVAAHEQAAILDRFFRDNGFDPSACVLDNALPHILSHDALASAVASITGRMKKGGIFVASIRDYDALLASKPPYSPPYIHKTANGQRVSFQTWTWEDDHYKLPQYLIDDGEALHLSKFECEYRATRRAEITDLLFASGCSEVKWLFPETTGFYQPVVARKGVKL